MRYGVIPVMMTEKGYTVGDETLGLIWSRIVDEGKVETVFYNGTISSVGDFIQYLRRGDVYPVVIFDTETETFCGVAWINNVNEGTAQAHFCTVNGGNSVEVGLEVMGYWNKFCEFINVIVGIIPEGNLRAINFVQKLGFVEVGMIPEYCNTVYKNAREGGVVLYYQLGGNK